MKSSLAILVMLIIFIYMPGYAQWPTLPIDEIQQVQADSDCSQWLYNRVQTYGIVTSGPWVFSDAGFVVFFLEMGDGGPYSGIEVVDPSLGYLISLGDSISVVGLIGEEHHDDSISCGMTCLWAETIDSISSGHPEPPPLIGTAAILDSTLNGHSLAEQYEGVLTIVYDVTIDSTVVYEWDSIWFCHDSTEHSFLIFETSQEMPYYVPPAGTEIEFVKGIVAEYRGNFSLPGYFLQPRYLTDIGNATSINSDGDHNEMPDDYIFFQSYPNPFNASTLLSYRLDKAGPVNLDIYDIQGRKVATLAEGVQDAGEHQITWNSADKSSGIYFARLVVAKNSKCIKLVVIK